MPLTISIVANRGDVASTLQLIKQADELGIPAAWLIQAGMGPDSLSVFTAAATQTKRIIFGTAIVPIWPRHPLALAQQVATVTSLAPGRLRLGLGPSGPGMASAYGFQYERPLGHMREYMTILKTLFSQGQVDFDGRYYTAHARLGVPAQPPPRLNVPVLASALQRGSYEFCGEVADGALSWVSPIDYLQKVALPALQSGAQKAGRPAPPLIAHVPVSINENVAEVYAAVREQLSRYPQLPHYQKMFTSAGFPEVSEGQWSDRMIEAVVALGDEVTVKRRIDEILKSGISEIMAHPIPSGAYKASSMTRILELLAALAQTG